MRQTLCGVLCMDHMESKSPPTVTHPLFHVLPGKQKHCQLTEGYYPGCICCEDKLNKPQGSALAWALPRFPEGPQQCIHVAICFCKICKRYFNCNQPTVSFHSDFLSVTLPLVFSGTSVAIDNLGIFLKGKLSWGIHLVWVESDIFMWSQSHSYN